MEKRMKKDKTSALACQIAEPAIQKSVKEFQKSSVPEPFTLAYHLIGSQKSWGSAIFDTELCA
eukprot:145753-Pyramimonas_sp.AAC.1